jgi:hypothetical protein
MSPQGQQNNKNNSKKISIRQKYPYKFKKQKNKKQLLFFLFYERYIFVIGGNIDIL